MPLREAARQVVAHHGLQQLFFAGEIQKQCALRDAGQVSHLFHPGSSKAFLHKQLERGIDQFTRTRVLAPLVLGMGRVGMYRGVGVVTHELMTDGLVM